MYLDAIGVPQSSSRRGAHNGAETWYKLAEGVEVWILDERWNRDPLPCGLRESWCEEEIEKEGNKMGWCKDYVEGNCCEHDESIYFGYCREVGAEMDELYDYACDHRSVKFGTKAVRIDEVTGKLTDQVDHGDVYGYGFCGMLGQTQREWFRRTLLESKAEVRRGGGERCY
jgi:alkaline phosphatase D